MKSWIPDQVRDDSVSVIADLIRNPWPRIVAFVPDGIPPLGSSPGQAPHAQVRDDSIIEMEMELDQAFDKT